MYKMFFKRLKGYFTVEASMIVPLVIVLIAFILYLTFYLYDRCIVTQDAYILAFRGTLCCGEDSTEIEQLVRSQSVGQYGSKYIGTNPLESRIRVDSKKVEVEVTGRMTAVNGGFFAKKEAERICPVECIRKVRLAQKIQTGIKEIENRNG